MKQKKSLRIPGLLFSILLIQVLCGTVAGATDEDSISTDTESVITTENALSKESVEEEAEITEASNVTTYASDKSILCDVKITGRSVTLSGQIENAEEAYPLSIFVGTFTEPICVRQITSNADGSFQFTFPLPKKLLTGEYVYRIGMPDDTPVLNGVFHYDRYEDPKELQYTADVDGRNVVISGKVLEAERLYEVSVFVGTETIPLCARQITTEEDGSFRLAFKLAEDLPSGEYLYQIDINTNGMMARGTLRYVAQGSNGNSAYSVYGNAGNEFYMTTMAFNQTELQGKVFEVSYNPEQVEPIGSWGLYPVDGIEVGQQGNVEILSHEDGKIRFQVTNVHIPEGKVWSGILNVFQFRFLSDYSGQTMLTLQ